MLWASLQANIDNSGVGEAAKDAPGNEERLLWHFSFGANMNPEVCGVVLAGLRLIAWQFISLRIDHIIPRSAHAQPSRFCTPMADRLAPFVAAPDERALFVAGAGRAPKGEAAKVFAMQHPKLFAAL